MAAVFTKITTQTSRRPVQTIDPIQFLRCDGKRLPRTHRRFAVSDSSLLRQLLDRQEITAMMAAYTRCADMNQPEQQAEVFVQDCRVKYHPADWIVGRGALVEALRTALARYSNTSHHLGNIEIDFDGPDSAAAQSTVIA